MRTPRPFAEKFSERLVSKLGLGIEDDCLANAHRGLFDTSGTCKDILRGAGEAEGDPGSALFRGRWPQGPPRHGPSIPQCEAQLLVRWRVSWKALSSLSAQSYRAAIVALPDSHLRERTVRQRIFIFEFDGRAQSSFRILVLPQLHQHFSKSCPKIRWPPSATFTPCRRRFSACARSSSLVAMKLRT